MTENTDRPRMMRDVLTELAGSSVMLVLASGGDNVFYTKILAVIGDYVHVKRARPEGAYIRIEQIAVVEPTGATGTTR